MLSSVDSLIFDIDGVLLNVDRSFPEVIHSGILEGFERFGGGVSDCEGFTAEHQCLLKRHGAFNDDYDITWFLTCFCVSKNSERLSACFPSVSELEEVISSFRMPFREWVESSFTDSVPYDEFRDFCFDLYAGTSSRKGLYLLEVPMLDLNWKDFPVPVGIYTGRDTTETNMALKSLGWQDFPREFIVNSSSGIKKPSPRGLEIVSRRTGSLSPCFFGDTASDLQAFEAFGKGMFVAIGELLPEADNSFLTLEDGIKFVLG
ncbi:MAG: HAD family hydrolase [Synergistaceae bacterium]